MKNVNFWLRGLLALMVVAVLGVGCESKTIDNQGTLTLAELQGQTPVVEEVVEVTEIVDGEEVTETVVVSSTDTGTNTGTNNAGGGGGWPSEIDGPIKWLHTNVSSWPVTASLNASVSRSTINMPYSKSKVWHAVGGLNANPWAIVKMNGRWYAGTFEYFRYGQTSKPVGVLDGSKGDHFKVSPLSGWRPSSGERFGIMVSGLARASSRNVKERSNVSMVTWP